MVEDFLEFINKSIVQTKIQIIQDTLATPITQPTLDIPLTQVFQLTLLILAIQITQRIQDIRQILDIRHILRTLAIQITLLIQDIQQILRILRILETPKQIIIVEHRTDLKYLRCKGEDHQNLC